MLYDYLIMNYKEAEPIFFSDIQISGIKRPALNQQMKVLCENGKLKKYDTGVYYLPKKSRLSAEVGPNADMVARYKYISRGTRIDGFYSGNTFANQMGISMQVPRTVEIVSNNVAAKVKEVFVGKRIFIVRKSHVPVTRENVYVLQMLELLKNLDAYLDGTYEEAREKFGEYIKRHGIRRADVDRYIRSYPVNVFKYYYELRLDDVLA